MEPGQDNNSNNERCGIDGPPCNVPQPITPITYEEWQPDFEQLQKILNEALENIDEEKLHTKHIFDRFDFDALVTTIVRKGSYLGFIIA